MTTAARIDELRKKFDENPRRFFAPLANELRKAGELSQAIALCREHLPRQPGHMSGYIVFGQALYESGDLAEARGVFEQALALDPENLIALRHLGDIARRGGDATLARRWYGRVLEADPRNDDIAAQLATLATPKAPMPAVPEPTAVYPAVPTPLPAHEGPSMESGTMPAPDASMHTVDIGAIPLQSPSPPPLLDLDTIEAVWGTTALETLTPNDAPLEAASHPERLIPSAGSSLDVLFDAYAASHVAMDVEAEAEVAADVRAEAPDVDDPDHAAPSDHDPFAFAAIETVVVADVPGEVPADAEAVFEEGLAAPEWPDTSALAARIGTPRAVTPVSVPIPEDAIAAFGREPQDPSSLSAGAPMAMVEAADGAEPAVGDVGEATMPALQEMFEVSTGGALVVRSEDPSPESAIEELPVGEGRSAATPQEAAAVSAAAELEEMVTTATDDDRLPWLAVAADESTPEDEVSAIAEALEEDARTHGEVDDVAVSDRSGEASVPMEASFADVFPSGRMEADDEEPGAVPSGEPDGSTAFVTETMAELLVTQGLTAQAVSVYEELVRRRPYDPVLSSRLAELREQQVLAPAAQSGTPVFTARERFSRLAARRAPRPTPAVGAAAPTPPVAGAVSDESLASLFGSEPMPQDDAAARTLAAAFGPAPEALPTPSLFSPTPAAGSVRQPTPLRPGTPVRSATPMAGAAIPAGGGTAFDRFFPDPAVSAGAQGADGGPAGPDSPPSHTAPSVGDDLAQFSAWLKVLGNS
ncbi:MAG: tetratricopeptide repeat protein [Gemmatimonas sp.]|jgi:tetratricopeptide (TPR) repeat protein|uniref:tetratricopeptide repeat protein n=3 Tax=Gemmatimonas sp. TaxID=1962908 RepID=UPI00391F34EE|nr:tetratricopeptide repeat protein [Gemmatimonadota bacterium]